jgi:hypothetical protein
MGAPATLPANFQGWDTTANPPQSLPANFNQWDQQSAPDQSGQITNDVGNQVFVPKEGEDFSDTVKRAVDYNKSLTPQQRQETIDKETATIPKKANEVSAAAAGIGIAGPALLAAPGEAVSAIKAIPGATEAILQHLEERAGEIAEQYPNLIKLAEKLGIPTATAGVFAWLVKHSK